MLQNKNLRIRGNFNCDTDIDKNIREIETQFRIDFKSLPQWKEVIYRIHNIQTECKKKIENAKHRKFQIVQKLYTQNYRASPFELTNRFARTANLWREMKYNTKQHKMSNIQRASLNSDHISIDNVIVSEESDIESNVHPNSEIIQTNDQNSKPELELDSKLNSPYCLPPMICTNQHKMLSSIGSDNIILDFKEIKSFEKELKSESNEIFSSSQTKLVKCYPEKLFIRDSSLNEQFLKFSLLNCSNDYVHIRFKNLSDQSYFKSFQIFPMVPLKLNPGLSKKYQLNFTLREKLDANNISLELYFRIGSKTSEEIFCIPIKGKIEIYNSVTVTETVNISQIYPWQVNAGCGYPKGIVQIKVYGNRSYELHIRKRDVDFVADDTRSIVSLKVNTPNTESLMVKMNDDDVEIQDRTLLTPKTTEINVIDKINTENGILTPISLVTLLLNDILNLVYEPFVFKNTYLRLTPKTRRIIFVYLTKTEHVGYHQRYYDFVFYDSDEVIFTKTIKVFAEVLPHPILIYPNILDMTEAPFIFGHCEDHITIINTHKVYPVSITIKTTNKMNRLFKITPRATSIPAKSRVNFNVRLCREQIIASESSDIMAYFTVKIIVTGHKSVYENAPPFYYEIIAPCTREFIGNQKEYINGFIESNPVETVLND